jgi:hypothetical protein
MAEVFGGLRLGLLMAVGVILLLLTANFQSFRLSLAVGLTIPAVIAGVVLTLWLTRTTLNIQSFMGAIMAIGVAVANAILLVTFAERSRVGGREPWEAAIEGARSRLRPILMTSFAMLAGMMPMAPDHLSLSGNDAIKVHVIFERAGAHGVMRRVAWLIHMHRRNAEVCLKLHLLRSTTDRIVERDDCALRPPIAFGQQRHRQKNRRGGRRKLDPDSQIASFAKTPFQSCPNIVEIGKVRFPFHPSRQRHPFFSALLQPSLEVSRVADGQAGNLGIVTGDAENVGARCVQETVAHHGADGAGRDHRLGNEAVDRGEDSSLIEVGACRHREHRVQRERACRTSTAYQVFQLG